MLYVKRGIEIKRRGTENVPAIMGFSYALSINEKIKEKENKRISEIKSFLYKGLQEINPQIKINGSLENSTPHILNVSIPNIDNEFFLLQLDVKGIEVSTKSACLRDEDESYVLKAICADSKNSIRFSFGRDTSMGDIKYTLKVISKLLNK
jgi:cysteine desulfurase